MAESFEDRISRMSAATLDLFRKQLPETLKVMGENERNTALERLSALPQFASLFQPPAQPTQPQQPIQPVGQPVQPQQVPWWKQAVDVAVIQPLAWLDENVSVPFAAAAASAFTPSTPGTAGLSWLEREKAEYAAWKEPSLFKIGEFDFRPTKGILESIPWFATSLASGGLTALAGIGAKTGVAALTRVAAAGMKVVRPLAAVDRAVTMAPFRVAGVVGRTVIGKGVAPAVERLIPRVGKLTLPSKEVLNEALYKNDYFRKFAQWSQTKPIINRIVRAVGGESAFVRPESILPEDIARREIINWAVLRETANDAQGLLMPRLYKFGNIKKVLDIADDGIVNSIVPKSGVTSKYLYDVLENPGNYDFISKTAKEYVDEFHSVLDEILELAAENGIKIPKKKIVHRIVEGMETLEGFEKSKLGSLFEVKRVHATHEAAVLAGEKSGKRIIYGLNPNDSIESTIRHYINKIADKRLNDEIKKLGKTALQKFSDTFPEEALRIANLQTRRTAAKSALDVVQRVLSYKAARIPGPTMAKIRAELPDIARKMDILFEIAPNNVDTLIAGMGKELRTAMRTSPKELKTVVRIISRVQEGWRNAKKITMGDIEDAITNLNIDKDIAARLITRGYRETYKANRKFFKEFMTANRNELQKVAKEVGAELSPLKASRSQFLQKYKIGGQILGEGEATFKKHPAFKNLIFDKDVVAVVENMLGDKGATWLRKLGTVSGISRMLTAALDLSAPFIQGLGVLGRRPQTWAKAVVKQLEFAAKPQNLQKYMTSPEVMAIRAERFAAGSSMRGFEYFESLLPLQKIVGKIPIVGEALQKGIRQTFGRGEAAFAGFGEVVRNEMWVALKREGMSEIDLRDLARTIDRMTGVMSSKALGIGATQADIESSFVFFAPRYTRASLSFVADMFKGGLSGAEARKSLGGLMVAGTTFYYGVAKMLGQEPNFDPTSGKFMTVIIEGERIGVGGILYSLLRLGGNLAMMDSPADLLKLDRFDNPFIKFMYGKSAPLTGLLVGTAIERANYLGEPFENIGDWAKFLAGKVTPFMLQSALEEGGMTVAGTTAQALGTRTWPQSPWDRLNTMRDDIAQSVHGMDWDDVSLKLGALEQLRLEQENPDLVELESEARERSDKIARGDSILWSEHRTEGEAITDWHSDYLAAAAREFDISADGRELRLKVKYADSIRRERYNALELNPRYAEIREYFSQPPDPTKEHPLDIARKEYYNLMYSGDLVDEFNNYDHEEADRREGLFVQQHGTQALEYVKEIEGAGRDEPEAVMALRQAQRILSPYWQIADEVWANYQPEARDLAKRVSTLERIDPRAAKKLLYEALAPNGGRLGSQVVQARAWIARYQNQWKRANPDGARMLRLFYSF